MPTQIVQLASSNGWRARLKTTNNPNKKYAVAAWGMDHHGNMSAFIKGEGSVGQNTLVCVSPDEIREIIEPDDFNGGGE